MNSWQSRINFMLAELRQHIAEKHERGERTDAPIDLGEWDADDDFTMGEFDRFGTREDETERSYRPNLWRFG